MASSAASGLLSRQLKLMQSDKDIPGISCGLIGNNVFEWEVMLMISDDCKYYGGKELNDPHAVCREMRDCRRVEKKMEREGADNSHDYRRILPRPPHLPTRIPPPTPQNDLPNPHLPPKRYGTYEPTPPTPPPQTTSSFLSSLPFSY